MSEKTQWQHSSGDDAQCVERAPCFPMCAAKPTLSLYPQFLCWCPVNFKSSSKFPRPSATLSNFSPTCIYPYISQLIGSAAQLQALGDHVPNRFGGPPMLSPATLPSPPTTMIICPLVILHYFAGGRGNFAFVPSPLSHSAP